MFLVVVSDNLISMITDKKTRSSTWAVWLVPFCLNFDDYKSERDDNDKRC